MGLISRALYAIRAPRVRYPDFALAAANAAQFGGIPETTLPTAQAELYQRLAWVYIAVTMVAQSCAVQPLSVLKLTGEDTEDVDNHEFERLLRRPNPIQSRFSLLFATFAYRVLTGNAYWWLNKASQTSVPDEIWLIPTNKIKPVPDGRLYIKSYEYDTGGGREPLQLPPEQIVHFRGWHNNNEFVGLSPVESFATDAIGDMAMSQWNANFFNKNNAKAAGALTFADLIPDVEWNRLKSEFKREYGGTERQLMMLRGVGQGGVQWVQMSANQSDMEFLAGRQFNKELIYQVFGVPAGLLDKNATEANAQAAKAVFSEYTLYPLLTEVAETITNGILPLYGDNLIAEFEDPRKADRLMYLQELQEYAKTHTLNEIRTEKYGDDPLNPDDPRGEMLIAEIGPGVSHSKREQEEERQRMLEQTAQAGQTEEPGEEAEGEGENIKGGPGSGHWGHAGRPGERGGSAPGGLGVVGGRVFDDITEADEWLKAQPSLNPDLTPEEDAALRAYKGEFYYDMNQELREAGWTTDERFEHIESAINKASLPEPVTVFRGTSYEIFDDGDMTGAIIEDAAFCSTSLSRDIARRHSDYAMVEITLPEGTRAINMENWRVGGFHQGEAELLLQHGSRFRVISDNYDDDPDERYLVMELVQ